MVFSPLTTAETFELLAANIVPIGRYTGVTEAAPPPDFCPKIGARLFCLTIEGNKVFIFGELTTIAKVNYKIIAGRVLLDIGYPDEFDILVHLSEQSPDIAIGMNERYNKEQGAGDQGMMYGYATNETKEGIPLPLAAAHAIARKFKEIRNNKYFYLFGPDGKCQVTCSYENDKPRAIETIVVSAQTRKYANQTEVNRVILDEILTPLFGDIEDINILINPTGVFIIGGPEADAGLTGRKIIVDTYGGFSHHGGGAFLAYKYKLTTQVSGYYEIITNNVGKQTRVKKEYDGKVIVWASKFEINKENYLYVEFLELVNNIKYSDYNYENTKIILIDTFKKMKLNKEILRELSYYYKGAVYYSFRKTIEEILYEIAWKRKVV